MNQFVKYFLQQKEEINNSKPLIWFGISLVAIHLTTWFFWNDRHTFPDLVAKNGLFIPTCWPFWQDCYLHPFLGVDFVKVFLNIYGLVSLLVGFSFLYKPARKYSYWGVLFLFLSKLFIFSQDAALMGNYHYMHFIVEAIYLFVSHKVSLLKIFIIMFYVAAGFLKFDIEWLSGMAYPDEWLQRMPWTIWLTQHPKLFEILNAYVIYLEILIAPLLLSRNRFIFWSAFVQVFLFHLFAYGVVGYYYPILSLCFLSIFLYARLSASSTLEPNFISYFYKYRQYKLQVFLISLYIFAAILPKIIPGDSAITGEGRLYTLCMFDALSECQFFAIAKFKNNERRNISFNKKELGRGVRIRCDPYFYFIRMKQFCSYYHNLKSFKDIDVYLHSKRSTESHYRSILSIQDFCSKDLSYHTFWSNAWIQK